MNGLRLPIGIQSFRRIREGGFYYVDKTVHIERMLMAADSYFLSRPRRFGKSLLQDTLKELFEGNEALFRGLHIHDRWDWSDIHPVVHISFGRQFANPEQIDRYVTTQLAKIERQAGLTSTDMQGDGQDRFFTVMDRLSDKTGKQVVVLVDEYDKPILDVLHDPDMARVNRDYLRGFYGVIKDCANLVRLTFVTGITMFSKRNLFSALNNLNNISLHSRYATICGYTEKDLDTVFAPELPGLDREKVRRWYNGYHWLGEERVYNPYDILNLFDTGEFRPHWFETGTPAYLFDLTRREDFNPLELERLPVPESRLTDFDMNRIQWEALLFQSGYLTIAKEGEGDGDVHHTLDYPNQEVRESLNSNLFEQMFGNGRPAATVGSDLRDLLASNDFEGFEECIRSHFAGLPYPMQPANQAIWSEYWFGGMVYMSLRSVEVDIRMEESSSRGRSDMVVVHADQVFVFEFKVINGEEASATGEAAEKAIKQIREKDYAGRYRSDGRRIHLIGMVFSKAARNLVCLVVEPGEA